MRTESASGGLARILERVMLAGVAVSAVCMLIGLVLFVATSHVAMATAVVTFGLLVLMATPGLRVAIAVIEAARAGDWFFVLIAAAVVVLLGLTAVLALRAL